MYCTKCGYEIAKNSNFCTGCGSDITKESSINNKEVSKNETNQYTINNLTPYIIIGVGIFIAILCYFFY